MEFYRAVNNHRGSVSSFHLLRNADSTKLIFAGMIVDESTPNIKQYTIGCDRSEEGEWKLHGISTRENFSARSTSYNPLGDIAEKNAKGAFCKAILKETRTEANDWTGVRNYPYDRKKMVRGLVKALFPKKN